MPPKVKSWIRVVLLSQLIGMSWAFYTVGLKDDYPVHENMSNCSVSGGGIAMEEDTRQNNTYLKAIDKYLGNEKDNYRLNKTISNYSVFEGNVTEKYNITKKDSDLVIFDRDTDNGATPSYFETSPKSGSSTVQYSDFGNANTNMNQDRPRSPQYDIRRFRERKTGAAETITNVVPYLWDKTKQTPRDFLLDCCKRSCGRSRDPLQSEMNVSAALEQNCDNFFCLPCACKTENNSRSEDETSPVAEDEFHDKFCSMGICCPERQEEIRSITAHSDQYIGCLEQPTENTYAVVRCPEHFSANQSLRDACELGRGEMTVDEPVVDPDTRIVYRNKHCAQCHEVLVYKSWRLTVACHSFQQLYRVMSEQELILQSRRVKMFDGSDTCWLYHAPASPRDVPPVDACIQYFFNPRTTQASQKRYTHSKNEMVIATCNVTGLWAHDDDDVRSGCETFTDITFRVMENGNYVRHKDIISNDARTGRIFQNLFCAICNGLQPARKQCTASISPGWPDGNDVPPLTLLLGLTDDRRAPVGTNHECARGQWIAFGNMCRNLSCPAGKYLNEDKRTCNASVKMIRGLQYSFHFALVPQSDFILPLHMEAKVSELVYEPVWATFHNITHGLIASVMGSFAVVYVPIFRATSPGIFVNTVQIKKLEITASIEASFWLERDEAEEMLLKNMLDREWVMNIEDVDRTVLFTPFSFGSRRFSDHDTTHKRTIPVLFSFDEKGSQNAEAVGIMIPDTDIIWLSRFLVCPSVEFDPSEFEMKREGTTLERSQPEIAVTATPPPLGHVPYGFDVEDTFTVVLMGKKLLLDRPDLSWMVRRDGSFVICVDTLEEQLARYKSRDSSLFWQYALSMSAIPLSILCLVLVIVVYALLPELRTQPGLNTMGMCAKLLVAQVALLLSSHRVLSGAWCVALGVVVHLSWLSTFCWTTVCSVQMYRSFSRAPTSGMRWGPGSLRVLACNELLTLLVSGAVVAIVMGLSWNKSGGHSIGYSSSMCYLRSPLAVGLAVVLPLSLTVAINFVLYLLSVYRIHWIIELQTRYTEGNGRLGTTNHRNIGGRQHVRACLRLSLLTGTTWLLSILAEGVGLDWLRVFSILANGGQGALLLVSYVTTRRVAILLAGRMGLRRHVTTTTTTITGNCV